MRHWRQRFHAARSMRFRRRCVFKNVEYKRGDLLPPETAPKTARRLWNARRIELADFDPPVRESSSRVKSIDAAIEKMLEDPGRDDLFTRSGVPRVEAIEEILGHDINAGERDERWAAYKGRSAGGG